jgi:HK97 family phage prohead protease
MMQLYASIIKADDEQRLVYGYASTEALDSQGEKVTKAAVVDALDDYMTFANLREMHQNSAVGITKEAEIDDKGLYIVGKVVDDAAWKKVKEGVYKGFSIGGRKITKIDNEVTKVAIREISLVDRPANPECTIELYKSEAYKEEMTLMKVLIADITLEKLREDNPDMTPLQVLQKYAGEEISDAMSAAYALQSIVYLYTKEMGEAHPEAAAQATALKAAIENLKAFIASEIQESDPGDVIHLSAKPGDLLKVAYAGDNGEAMEESFERFTLEKVGASISASNKEKIQAIHDHASSLGASCGSAEKLDISGDLQKIAADRDEALQKLETLTTERDTLATEKADLLEKMTRLEAAPADGKGVVKTVVVTKADDAGAEISGETKEKVEKVAGLIESGNSDGAALELLKIVHQVGGTPLVKARA